jgi:hypothetical protein
MSLSAETRVSLSKAVESEYAIPKKCSRVRSPSCLSVDLQHMRAVKADKHAQFADDNQLYSYFVSAKSGDHVQQAFYRIAADLAGIVLTKTEIDQKAVVVQAEIINHPQHDPTQEKVSGETHGDGSVRSMDVC